VSRKVAQRIAARPGGHEYDPLGDGRALLRGPCRAPRQYTGYRLRPGNPGGVSCAAPAAHSEFYNTLITNCTTTILLHAQASGGQARYNWKILLSGYAPKYAYELGRLDTSMPFADLKRRSQINKRAREAGDTPDFSQRIRHDLPRPSSMPGAP
jgi:hypothetical protein